MNEQQQSALAELAKLNNWQAHYDKKMELQLQYLSGINSHTRLICWIMALPFIGLLGIAALLFLGAMSR